MRATLQQQGLLEDTVNHPRTNAVTERLNKTMADKLTAKAGVEHGACDGVLSYVVFACDTTVLTRTRMTPFEPVCSRQSMT